MRHRPMRTLMQSVAPGDLWELGSHLLLCGDARDPAAYVPLLG